MTVSQYPSDREKFIEKVTEMPEKNAKVIVLVVVVAVLALIIGLVATSLKKLDSFESR